MQKSNSQLSETRILRHQSVGKFNYSGCCRNAAMTSAHPHRHCPDLQHNFVPRKRFNLHQMHFQGHFVPRKRFKRNKIMMLKFHKDETSHLVPARTMYFHPSRSGIWADGNFSIVTKEESNNKKKTPRKKPKCLVKVEIDGVEPTTLCLQSRCSSQLSYIPKIW